MSDPGAHPTDLLHQRIRKWIEKISTPEFRQFKSQQISYMISDDFDRKFFEKEHPDEFLFGDTVEKQHALVLSFLELVGSTNSLAQCEYYFRRFPFQGLPISKNNHITNICELYFGHFYIIKNKIWIVAKRLKQACPTPSGDMKAFIKSYVNEFEQELDWRNKVTHQYAFSDLNIDRILFTEIMSSTEKFKRKGWDREHRRAYRALSKEWSDRVKQRSIVMQKFVDAVAQWVLDNNTFL